MSKKTYYKVTTENLKSMIDNELKLSVQYKIGEFVSSSVPETPLCVFDNFRCAKRFANNYGTEYKIFTCEIKTKLKTPWIPFFRFGTNKNLSTLLSKIRGKQKFMDYVWTILPKGTVCVKQVKLLEEVK
jgi:hypothetical protein